HGGSALVGDICTWDLSTSKEICLGQFTSDEFPDWASVRGRYVFHNYEIDPAKGTVVELFPRPGALIGWSPDAAKVAYVEGSAFGQGPRSLIIFSFRSVVTGHRRSGSRRVMGPIRSSWRTVMLSGTDPSSRPGAHKPISLLVPSPYSRSLPACDTLNSDRCTLTDHRPR